MPGTMYFDLLKRFDWAGLGLMAAFLGCLEYVLEEGPTHDSTSR
jgi:DHA2 family multidrug resistance protein